MVSISSLVHLSASNGFAVVMSEKRFARRVALIPDVVAIFAFVVHVDVHTLKLLKQTGNILVFSMSWSMPYTWTCPGLFNVFPLPNLCSYVRYLLDSTPSSGHDASLRHNSYEAIVMHCM